MNFEIRCPYAADAKEMILYIKKVGSETDFLSFCENTFNMSEEKERKFLERFKSSNKNLMLIALDGDKIIANASIEGNRVQRYSHRAELSITVLRDYWNKGIGTTLMKNLIEFSKSAGYKSIYLDVRSDNEKAISLYKKFGFVKIGVYNNYFFIKNKFYDADLMVLYL